MISRIAVCMLMRLCECTVGQYLSRNIANMIPGISFMAKSQNIFDGYALACGGAALVSA